MARKGKESWGWDAAAKTFVRVMTGNAGEWGVAWSGGWQEDKMSWTGEFNNIRGKKMEFRHTFTKKSDRELADTAEFKIDGLWKVTRECTYKK